MNVLILTTHMNTGGISQYVSVLSRGLHRHGTGVWVVSSGGDKAGELAAVGVGHIELNIRTKSELSWKLYAALGPLSRLIKEKNIDVVHTQTRVTQVLGTLLEKRTGAVHVSTCHGFFRPRWFRKMCPCWGRAVIAISAPVRRHLIEDFGIDEKRVFLIPNGIDVNEFAGATENSKAAGRRELHLGDEPVIGIIARLSDVKGHDILIRAFKNVVQKYPGAKLVIIGQGKEEKGLKKLVEEQTLAANVVFYPVLGKTSQLLPAFDVFVMPSLQEGLGLSVMEAQAAGLPVVASRVGGIPDLIEDGKTGLLVEPRDVEGLARAVIRLLDDKGYAGQLARAGQEFIRKNFSAEKMVEATIKTYEFVLETEH
jgi:glycosyltransferase involved in cell wall biosynthesis